MPFTPPNTPLGNFVRQNYKTPGLQRRVFTKLKNKGFTPPATGGLTTVQRQYLPPELIGVEGVRGAYRRPPRLNPEQWVTHVNRYGSFFAAPRTELTGLDPESKRQVSVFDEETGRRVPGIQSAYADLQTSLNQNADASKARLESLGQGIYSSPTLTPASQQGVPGANEQLADTNRRDLAARAAVTVGQQGALSSLAATEGTEAVEDFRSARRTGREELISGLRQQAAAAQAAQAERAAQLRGQDLQLLGTQLSQAGGLERALVGAGSRERINSADLEARLLIAEMEGNVREANSIRAALARQYAADRTLEGRLVTAGSGGRSISQREKDRRKATAEVVKSAREAIKGKVVLNPAYRRGLGGEEKFITRPGISATDPLSFLEDALARGAKPLPVLRAIRANIHPQWGLGGGQEGDAGQILKSLLGGGVPREQAFKIVKLFSGVDLRPGAGAFV